MHDEMVGARRTYLSLVDAGSRLGLSFGRQDFADFADVLVRHVDSKNHLSCDVESVMAC